MALAERCSSMTLRKITGLGTQLGLAFASIILLLGGMALLAWGVSGKNQREAQSLVQDRLNPVIQITTVREALVAIPVRLANGIATGRMTGRAGAADLARARAEAERQWKIYLTTYLLPDEVRWIEQAEVQRRALTPVADVLQALMNGHRPGQPDLENWLNDRYLRAAEPLERTLTNLIHFQERTGAAMLQAMNQRQRRLNWSAGVCVLGAIGLAALLAFRFSNALGRHATALVSHLQHLAEGDLAAPPFQAEDGQWNQMAQDLDRIVGRLRDQATLLETLERKARASDQAKSTFVANMSHELRTPLSAILGYARLMVREPGRGAEDVRQLGHILRAGEHLLTLINDVLTLSRMEAGRLELSPAPFLPGALAHDLRSLFQLTAQGRGLALHLELDGFPERVTGDLPKLRQVLVNLLGNAVKFTEGGEVRLAARWVQGQARFEVTDTGPGMTREEQARLFQPFSQAEAGVSKGGTGLGLHITRSLVQAMGGDIDMESCPGRGSRFGFEIPLPASEAAVRSPAADLASRLCQGQGQPLVLVVDDREENREVLSGFLTLAGFRTAQAGQGAEALDLWQALSPDLVLMDLRMPVMDGFEAIKLLRQRETGARRPRTPVVAVSASVYNVDEASLRALGFDGYLPKPVEDGPLFTLVGRILGLRFEPVGLTASPPAQETRDLAVLEGVDAAWRKGFKDWLAMGDLEAAERCLEDLADTGLRDALRGHLREYNLQGLLDRLG